jgi:acetone carboxylase gamma subunit
MNERIDELMIEAGARFEFLHGVHYDDFQYKKFAELIVRECMKESMDEIVADEDIAQEKDPLIREYFLGNNQGIVDAVVRFRNHFGVEE